MGVVKKQPERTYKVILSDGTETTVTEQSTTRDQQQSYPAMPLRLTEQQLKTLEQQGWNYSGYKPGYGFAGYGELVKSRYAPQFGVLYREVKALDTAKLSVAQNAPQAPSPRCTTVQNEDSAPRVSGTTSLSASENEPGALRELGCPTREAPLFAPARPAAPCAGGAPSAPCARDSGAPSGQAAGRAVGVSAPLPVLARGDATTAIERIHNGFGIPALDAMRGREFTGPHVEVGFDTEYVEVDGVRYVLTYQFTVLDGDAVRQWIMFSMTGERLSRDDALAVVIRGMSPAYEYADYQCWFVHMPVDGKPGECELVSVHAPRITGRHGSDERVASARARVETFLAMCEALPYDEERTALMEPARMTKAEARDLPVIGRSYDKHGAVVEKFTYRGLLRAESSYDDDRLADHEEPSAYRYRDVFAGTRASGCSVGYTNDYTDVGRDSAGERDPDWRLVVTLVEHFGMADATTFERGMFEKDLMTRLSKVQGGLVTLRPVSLMVGTATRSWAFQQVLLNVRDTMCYAPAAKKTLAALGKAIGLPKIDIPHEWKENMDQLWTADPVLFCEYAVNDAVIALFYAKALFGENNELPVTANGAAARVARQSIGEYLGCSNQAEFDLKYRGLVKIKRGMAYTATGMVPFSKLTPHSTDAATVMNMASAGYHGGLNGCMHVGHFPHITYDVDARNAYPTGMMLVVDIDWTSPILREWRDAELSWDDFDAALGPCTPLLAEVEFEFPRSVYQPSIGIACDGSLVFPCTSKGANVCVASGPELWAAKKLGARVIIRHAVLLRTLRNDDGVFSRSLSEVCRMFVESRAQAVEMYGAKSLAELLAKLGINCNYGKVSQGVSPKATYNAMTGCMEDLEGSSITSPYHACMITALVRVLLVMAINQLHDLGYEVFSVTTDGFITDAPADVIEELDLYGLAKYFREARLQLTGYKDPSVWSLKHVQDDLCNFTTRGNVSLRVGGADSVLGGHPGVCAHNSLVTGEEKDSYEDRHALMLAVASRTGRVETHKARPTSFRALTSRSERADFGFRDQGRYLSMDFDMKRRPLRETLAEGTLTLDGVDFKVASVDTAPWDSVEEFMKGKRLGERIAREGGCLRTRADWDVWFLRYGLEGAYVSKDPVWTLVRAAVCAYRQGALAIGPLAALDTGKRGSVDACCRWINRFIPRSSKHHGKFNANTWKDCRKSNRNIVAPEDMLAEIVECMRSDDPDSWLVLWP